jgi:ABC-type Fe3+/spermidine/putrescine transport system ATPase subunit
MTAILDLRNVTKVYDNGIALDDLSVELNTDEYISLLGPSGSGKSTLLRVIAGYEKPDSGDILLADESVVGVPAHKRGIGFVSQSFALFPHMSVFDNVAFGLRHREDDPVRDEGAVTRRVNDMLELVGLLELGDRNINQISGGQKQRVALARTLVADPKIILLDEPLGALDANLRARMRAELRRIRQQLGITFLHVTGNEEEALAMGDRVAVLDSGRLAQIADPDTVYNLPESARVARFLNCYNMFEGQRGDKNQFRIGNVSFPFSSTRDTGTGPGTYCVRFDKIRVAPATEAPRPGEAGVQATFITSEYSGPRITYFFAGQGNKVLEVEYHLGHRRPEEFSPGQEYSLLWSPEDALVYFQ